jgi:hypothetical protein
MKIWLKGVPALDSSGPVQTLYVRALVRVGCCCFMYYAYLLQWVDNGVLHACD